MNFKNLTVRLYVLILSFMLAKFQEDKNQLLCQQTNVKMLSFCDLKFCIINKFIDQIVINI